MINDVLYSMKNVIGRAVCACVHPNPYRNVICVMDLCVPSWRVASRDSSVKGDAGPLEWLDRRLGVAPRFP